MFHKQTAGRKTSEDSTFLASNCKGAFFYQHTFISYVFSCKNTLEKVICRQVYKREAFQHGLIMLMSFTDGLPSEFWNNVWTDMLRWGWWTLFQGFLYNSLTKKKEKKKEKNKLL